MGAIGFQHCCQCQNFLETIPPNLPAPGAAGVGDATVYRSKMTNDATVYRSKVTKSCNPAGAPWDGPMAKFGKKTSLQSMPYPNRPPAQRTEVGGGGEGAGVWAGRQAAVRLRGRARQPAAAGLLLR
jgi:hypothetical protein